MCYTTETSIVINILQIAGAGKVSVHITTRTVYVDHFPKDVGAAELAAVLTTKGFLLQKKRMGISANGRRPSRRRAYHEVCVEYVSMPRN
mmetsp:Transcript_9672/g.11986  ORF Transcript_9672/g.11986 Transcript_9672/m.11986 type:complete len:90 (+) Transcript_9672:316-585(+)